MPGIIILALGILNLILLWFQIASGRRWIKINIKVHRKTGIALVASGAVHGALALLVNLL